MKKILIVALAIGLLSCNSTKKVQETASSKEEVPETVVERTEPATTSSHSNMGGSASNPNMLYGLQKKEDFTKTPFASWFNSGYQAYKADPETMRQLKTALNGVTIKAFMGTWCGDSKRETPRMFRILDELDYNLDDMTLAAVDRSKAKPADLVSGNNIKRVPTFIFYKNGEELGRFVEYAVESLEKDMLKIVTGQAYKHPYE